METETERAAIGRPPLLSKGTGNAMESLLDLLAVVGDARASHAVELGGEVDRIDHGRRGQPLQSSVQRVLACVRIVGEQRLADRRRMRWDAAADSRRARRSAMAVELAEVHNVGAVQRAEVHGLVRALVELPEEGNQQITHSFVLARVDVPAELVKTGPEAVLAADTLNDAVALEHAEHAEGGRLAQVRAAGELADADA